MKRVIYVFTCLLLTATSLSAQEKDSEEKKGFKKENLFTGGGISLGFGFNDYGNSFSVGASPVFGYSVTNWLDAGIVVNYIYTSYKNYPTDGYKVRISDYGGGAFAKLYPLRFLFLQAQFEHNFSHQKYIPGNGTSAYTYNYDGNSLLLGAGYAGGRDPLFKRAFFHIAVLFDVLGDVYSPYTDSYGRIVPNIAAGVQIPLFQGRKEDRY
jgi:hypothetical protein